MPTRKTFGQLLDLEPKSLHVPMPVGLPLSPRSMALDGIPSFGIHADLSREALKSVPPAMIRGLNSNHPQPPHPFSQLAPNLSREGVTIRPLADRNGFIEQGRLIPFDSQGSDTLLN